MSRVYLRINTAVGREKEVRDALRRIRGVKSADMVTGRYDVIAIVEEETYESTFKTVLDKVRSIKGVTKTETDLVIE
ncbi:MAG TPA: Lrp/AsnC ligand binding domain-containing protein [Nitrospiria bacterium]|jgi:DNA-binding Lrp family transcriptional regulator|nr:Lrp/AsnC ligand binding domain-containing protein [Nitrospiria bacterium]